MKTHFVYIFQAYDLRTDDGYLRNSVQVEVIAPDVDAAQKKVESLVTKPFYLLSMIIEKED